jgi:hypothetical protein
MLAFESDHLLQPQMFASVRLRNRHNERKTLEPRKKQERSPAPGESPYAKVQIVVPKCFIELKRFHELM